jgi:hypothetical protein
MTQSDQKSYLRAVWVARRGIDDLETRGLMGGPSGGGGGAFERATEPWQTGPGGPWAHGPGVWELMTQSDQLSYLGAVWVARPGIDDLETRGLLAKTPYFRRKCTRTRIGKEMHYGPNWEGNAL